MIYKSKRFEDDWGLMKFLNDENIKPENIISIIHDTYAGYRFLLIYAEEK